MPRRKVAMARMKRPTKKSISRYIRSLATRSNKSKEMTGDKHQKESSVLHTSSLHQTVNWLRMSDATKSQEETVKTLCEVCQYIFDHLPNREYKKTRYPFHESTSFMKEAAMNGCLLCGQFLRELIFRDESDFIIEDTQVVKLETYQIYLQGSWDIKDCVLILPREGGIIDPGM